MNWSTQSVQGRLKTARKYELLVPFDVPLALILGGV